MPVSKAQIKATTKYETANYDKVLLRLPKGKRAEIKAHAEKRGESINGFVGRAINETMQRDNMELPGAGQLDPDTESKRAALLEKLQGVPAGKDGKK